MRFRQARATGCFLLFVFFLTGCHGQRAFTYKLHNRQNDGQYSTLHRMPDGALLMVSKRFAQPKQIWNLVRIAAWDTSQPREEKLDVDVGPNKEDVGEINWTSQGDGFDLNDQLLMDPGGNYLKTASFFMGFVRSTTKRLFSRSISQPSKRPIFTS